MSKRLLFALVCLFMLLVQPVSAAAATADEAAPVGAEVTEAPAGAATSGTTGDCKWSYNTSTAELKITGNGRMADYDSQYKVPWNDYVYTAKTITIASGVTYVGERCFIGYNETTLTIADTVTEIGDSAFCYSSKVTSFKLSSKVKKIGSTAFMGLGVTDLTLPKTLTKVSTWVFYGCKNLKTLTIPDSCACEFSDTFESCTALETVSIGKKAVIGDRCFADSPSMKEYKVSSDHPTLTVGGKHLFNKDKTKLMFYCNGNGAKSSSFSNDITEIGDYALYKNPTLTTLTLPNKLEKIGSDSFAYSQLTTLNYAGSSLYSVGAWAFEGTPWYKNQKDGLVYAGTVAYRYKGTAPAAVSIKSGTLGIGDRCFKDQTSLTRATLPASLIHIGQFAFWGCSNLETATIPGKLRSIAKGAFDSCTSITSIILPDTVTELGDDCFYKCSSMSEFRISPNITYLPRWAFGFCSSLTGDFAVPEKVTLIGWDCFYRANGLSSVTVTNRNTEFETESMRILNSDFVLRGYRGSTAEAFAKAEHVNFEPLDILLSGSVTSFLSTTDKVTLTLIPQGATKAKYTTTVKGNSGEYQFSDVLSGTYTLRVKKKNHVTRDYTVTLKNDLTQNVKIHPLGDINGDGEITTRDYSKAFSHVTGTRELKGYELACADVTGSVKGEITTRDLSAIFSHVTDQKTLW